MAYIKIKLSRNRVQKYIYSIINKLKIILINIFVNLGRVLVPDTKDLNKNTKMKKIYILF